MMTRFSKIAWMLMAVALVSGCKKDATTTQNDAGVTDASAMDASDGNVPATDASLARDLPEYFPTVELGRHNVTVVETRQVIPGNLPSQVTDQNSNNNLDVAKLDGRVYLAWRTAPSHFASPLTRLYVISSADEVNWDFEAVFSLDSDIREPRFLVWNGQIFLYVARLGNNATTFTPLGMSMTTRNTDGTWTALTPFYDPDYLAWRTKVERGTPYMLTYLGGEHIYDFSGLPISIAFLTTTDGTNWTPVDPEHPFIYTGGGSETDFVISDDNMIYGVIRNEEGDSSGIGSNICHASLSDPAYWSCTHDPKKYDSPLMFWYDGEAYLIGRRNVTETGNFELPNPTDAGIVEQSTTDGFAYWYERKRCSLWRYVQGEDRIAYVLDLPSRGDTCYAGILETDTPGVYTVYDYSSPLDGPDLKWNQGQNGFTHIYRHTLSFTPRDGVSDAGVVASDAGMDAGH